MSRVAMTDEEIADALSALEKAGADPRCPSCKSLDWSGWGTGAIPKVLDVDEPAPPYLEERLDPERRLIDWAHGLKVLALICNRCGFLRLHAPAKLLPPGD